MGGEGEGKEGRWGERGKRGGWGGEVSRNPKDKVTVGLTHEAGTVISALRSNPLHPQCPLPPESTAPLIDPFDSHDALTPISLLCTCRLRLGSASSV